jgi:hypothetical protein
MKKKLDLTDRETNRLINELTDVILDIIDNQDQFTRSDLQGAVQAQVINILTNGLNLRPSQPIKR